MGFRDQLTEPGCLPEGASAACPAAPPPIVTGKLLAIAGETRDALVMIERNAQPQVVRARATVDLHAAHIGQTVVLAFEAGDITRPIVLGVLRGQSGWPLPDMPAQVEVEADGERMLVRAREQLVLACGEARIVLHRDGRIDIKGHSIVSEAVAVNRIRGGRISLN
ncbi:hypothetical protein AWB70_01774 [Caballeronia cordobensis]|uniref:DUF6484 domain-containing protein n=1 Tax=Caballeronia cordobensis TaxID=1353886 RepID=A0A158GCM7_CABCO|nr:DUF6484 domain-containing protein [Caballeronia cordobensis]SAL29663.1 hypothetical protein AWB70_01774 [Caballeronia cordobensis]